MVHNLRYSINNVQEESRQLVETVTISRQQPICILCQFVPPHEWLCVECELERNNFLLRDRIVDLLAQEEWTEN